MNSVALIGTDKIGQPSGVAGLDAGGKVPAEQLPAMNYVPTTRKVNDKALSADITLTAADVGAAPSSHVDDAVKHITAAERTAWNGKAAGSHTHAPSDLTTPVPITKGGTGETTAAAARTALGAAVPSTQVSATLTTTWAGTAAPYTQAVTITGMTATKNGIIGLAPTATVAERTAAKAASLMLTSQGTNTITITADGDKPTIALPIVVTMMG